MTRRANPEPRRCSVCDRREKPGENFHTHEWECLQAEWTSQAEREDERRRVQVAVLSGMEQ